MVEIPKSMYSPEWAYIYTPDRPETGVIEKVEVSDGESGQEDTIILYGRFEESILNKRCFLAEYEGGISVEDNARAVTEWLRKYLPSDVTVIEPQIIGVPKTLDPSLSLLGDTCFSEMKTIGASIRVGYDFETNKRTAQVWAGNNRTQSQTGYPWAVFSDTWGTLKGYSASVDKSKYRNTCYVLYDYEEPLWDEDGNPRMSPVYSWPAEGNGTLRVLEGYTIAYTTKRGNLKVRLEDGISEDIETFVDCREDKPSADSAWSREMIKPEEVAEIPDGLKEIYDEYPKYLEEQGLSLLGSDYQVEKLFDAGIIDLKNYMVDFDLGDLVELSVESIGILQEARIVEVDEVFDANGYSVSVEIGDKKVRRIN